MYNKCIIASGIGAILGIIIGILFYLALIPSVVTAIWIALGFAVLSLIILSIISVFGKQEIERCICFKGKCLLIAALGTLLTAIIALSIVLTTGTILIAILIGLGAAFFIMSVIAFYDLFSCIIKFNCKCREM